MLLIKDSKLYILLVCLGLLFFLNPYLKADEDILLRSGYRKTDGMSQNTLFLKIMGMKKVGTAFIWIDQVLSVGEGGDPEIVIKKIKNNSDKMSYLDPYFLTNYNFSGSILGLIRIYKRFDLASEIYEKGIEYNPDDLVLKNYFAGMMAASKNNMDGLLMNFERVVNNTRDDLLTNMVAYLYERRYKKLEDKKDLEKAFKYWGMLANSKDEKYKEIGIRKKDEYKERN
jgi:tetratricopeptide (TPR) repeat protein